MFEIKTCGDCIALDDICEGLTVSEWGVCLAFDEINQDERSYKIDNLKWEPWHNDPICFKAVTLFGVYTRHKLNDGRWYMTHFSFQSNVIYPKLTWVCDSEKQAKQKANEHWRSVLMPFLMEV